MGMTIGEKIIARAAKVDQVKAGEIHTIEVDRLMSNDGTTHLTIDMYHNQLKHPKIADKDKLVFIMDHNVPAENPKTAAAHRKMRNFAKEHEIKLYEGKGVCHQIMVENHVCPGEFIMGADSHTCTYGALGAFGTGIGCTDFLYAMVTGQSWVLVPDTIRFNLHGKLREGVYARDLMLSIIGMVGANGCNYKIMEFAGEGAHNLDIDERLVLCNLAVEAGAKTGIVEPDEKVVEYVESRGRKAENLFKSDDDAVFEKVYDINLDEIKPVVARPHQIDDVVDAKEVKDVKIDEAFLGSCNNGRIEELRVAAEILKGKKVSDSVRFLIAPASNEVYMQALDEGLIDIFMESGAMVMNCNCSVCWGSCQGVIGKDEVLISTAGMTEFEEDMIRLIEDRKIPYLKVYNKMDLANAQEWKEDKACFVSAKDKKGIWELKEEIGKLVPTDDDTLKIVGDLVCPNDFVILVVPIDSAAPKGRLILPQQQTIRDLLEAGAASIVVRETELEKTLEEIGKKPALVITDSQAFGEVSKIVPEDVKLTSFSILFARYKGDLEEEVRGVKALEHLEEGAKILIAEGCTHHRQCDDIGTVKIPRWLKQYTGKDFDIHTSSGNSFPEDLDTYDLVIHCGGCTLNRREMKNRIARVKDAGVPIVNYGIFIAATQGILKRTLEPFEEASRILNEI